MSKLQELIQQLCPDGVELHEMGEVCKLVTGATPSKANPAFWMDGTIPWMSSGEVNNKRVFETESKITQLGYDRTSTTIVPIHTVIIALAGQGKTRGKVAITEIELCINQSLCSIICGPSLNYKFLYYYLDGKYEELRAISNGDGTRGGLSLKILSPYKIPVPPLPVQREIVRILDNFTELTAELTARRKQYEYYRDKLLTFDVHGGGTSDVVWRTVGEVADISRGKIISKDFIYDNPGIYPVYSSQTQNDGELGRIASFDYSGEYLTWTTDGANAGSIFYRNGKFSITNVCGLLTPHTDTICIRFLFHTLAITAKSYVSAGMGNPKLMSNVMASIKIPVPSMEVQKNIATILDRFDTLCNDLTAGLPAEIEARQRQYEYYRDKLLSFKELTA